MPNKIILGAGCFWGVEAALKTLPGVLSTDVGYCGGHLPNPSYEVVCSGASGHAEVVEVIFDPEKISLKQLLYFFYQIHDPTSLNKQGNDLGTQYRSSVFCESQTQLQQTIETSRLYASEQSLKKPLVTEIKINTNFWIAEDYHQDYLDKNPSGYCHISLSNLPKVSKI